MMRLFMRQQDLVSIAKFIDEFFDIGYSTSTYPPLPWKGMRHLNSPELAGRDVMK